MRAVFRRQGWRSDDKETEGVKPSFLSHSFMRATALLSLFTIVCFLPHDVASEAAVGRNKNKTEAERIREDRAKRRESAPAEYKGKGTKEQQSQVRDENPSPEESRRRTQEYKMKIAEARKNGIVDKEGVIQSKSLDSGSLTVMRFVSSVVSKLDVKEMDTLKIGGVRSKRNGQVRAWTSEHGVIEFDAGVSRLVRFDALTDKFPVPLGIKVGMESDKAWNMLGRPDRTEFGNGWFIGSDERIGDQNKAIGYLSFQCKFVQPSSFVISRIVWSQNRPSIVDTSKDRKIGEITTMNGACHGFNCSETEIDDNGMARHIKPKK